MKNYNKKILILLIAAFLFSLMLVIFSPYAGASNSQYLEIECGQEYILVERDDGYKDYEAWLTWTDTWEGLELTSMTAKYWNGVKTINSKIGFSDNRQNLFSPHTCTQIESKKFGMYIAIPTEEAREESEYLKLEKKYDELKNNFASMVEEATKKTIKEILNNIKI